MPPTVQGTPQLTAGGGADTFVADMPSGVTAGERLMVFAHCRFFQGINFPSPWVRLDLSVGPGSAEGHMAVGYLDATGSVSDVELESNGSNFNTIRAWAVRLAGHDPTVPPEIAKASGATSTFPAPPSLEPSWGTDDTMWWTMFGCFFGTGDDLVSYPLADNQLTAGGGSIRTAICSEVITTDELVPDPFEIDPGRSWHAFTVAIAPEDGGSSGTLFERSVDPLEFNLEFSSPNRQASFQRVQSPLSFELGFSNPNRAATLQRQANPLAFDLRFGTVHHGDIMFEPELLGEGTLADRIMASLTDQGFTSGTLADRERARLLAKLELDGVGLTILDLYSLADEPVRILGTYGEPLP